MPRLDLQPKKVVIPITLAPQDRHFIKSAALTLGISQGELIRRFVHEARVKFLEVGLYSVPPEGKSS